MDTDLDWTFPRYNPNPEDHAMLMQMAARVRETGADLALGFDGDGDRCGVVDDTGEEIYADKIGLMLGRDLSALHPNATFVGCLQTNTICCLCAETVLARGMRCPHCRADVNEYVAGPL
jgi:phosphomannomutase